MTLTRDQVAVKAMRGIQSDKAARVKFEEVRVSAKVRVSIFILSPNLQQLGKLVLQWQELHHPNVIHCIGLTMQFGPIPALIFPMCAEGSIMQYIEKNPSANKIQLVNYFEQIIYCCLTHRPVKLAQVAGGFNYLHHHGIVHADIRGVSTEIQLIQVHVDAEMSFQSNILIRDDGTPQIMDAGLSLIVSRADFTNASVCGPCRWMPPEVLEPSDDLEYDIVADSDTDNIFPFSLQSDVYSLGMTILEVLTGKAPYHHRRYDTVVILDIIHGTPPPRPAKEVMPDGVWTMLHHCWKALPECRPQVRGVELWLDLIWKTEETRTLYKLQVTQPETSFTYMPT